MSQSTELQELIAKQSMLCYDSGARAEREWIVKLLKERRRTFKRPKSFSYVKELDALIHAIETVGASK